MSIRQAKKRSHTWGKITNLSNNLLYSSCIDFCAKNLIPQQLPEAPQVLPWVEDRRVSWAVLYRVVVVVVVVIAAAAARNRAEEGVGEEEAAVVDVVAAAAVVDEVVVAAVAVFGVHCRVGYCCCCDSHRSVAADSLVRLLDRSVLLYRLFLVYRVRHRHLFRVCHHVHRTCACRPRAVDHRRRVRRTSGKASGHWVQHSMACRWARAPCRAAFGLAAWDNPSGVVDAA